MKARGPWLVFAVALVLVGTVMAWVTARLVALERERAVAQQQAAHEETIRLALWRIDSTATPLLSQEIAAVGVLAEAPEAAAGLVRPDEVRARFVVHTGGEVSVVGVPAVDLPLALSDLLGRDDLLALFPGTIEANGGLRLENPVANSSALEQQIAREGAQEDGFYSAQQQKLKNAVELSKRSATVEDNVARYGSSLSRSLGRAKGDGNASELPEVDVDAGPVRPLWLGAELVLARRVRLHDGPALHGSWLNWPMLERRLLDEVSDALPDARLVPVTGSAAHDPGDRLLATLPVRLDPGATPPVALATLDVLGPSLALGWAGMLVAALAVFALLRWSFALSERRAAFVSAVTHELRTPLTTFRMYTEMLSEGMVDEAKRARYVGTLRREADRLGDLVENVLAYSRIESDRSPVVLEALTVRTLVERAQERLEARARAAGLDLVVEIPESVERAIVRVDPTAVEQILFNLVDNAAKYGPSQDQPRIVLDARDAGRRVAVGVRDHGPGILVSEREAIFEPFAKGAAEAAGTKPGVGLGLALARRLARQLGGDLVVETAEPGARFVLTLPRAA